MFTLVLIDKFYANTNLGALVFALLVILLCGSRAELASTKRESGVKIPPTEN